MNIAIWGLGLSGLSALRYLHSQNHSLYAINEGHPSHWSKRDEILEYIPEDCCFEESESIYELDLDQIILAPGVDRKSPLVKYFIDKGVEVIGEVELAYRSCELPIVAITGTNGKTTTTTMISECLEQAGQRVFCCGNIGVPFCDVFARDIDCFDIIVIELSSFQLESMPTFRAQIAIILNIEESHMERYDSFEDYSYAKLNIFNNQKDSDLAIAPKNYLPEGGTLLEKTTEISLEETKLVGEHHLYNLFCVVEVLKFFKIREPLGLVKKFLVGFAGMPFRLEYICEKNGILFYNDSKSTNLFSTLVACRSLKGKKICLILGGKLRDDSTKIFDVLKEIKMTKVLAFGEAKEHIIKELEDCYDVTGFESLSHLISSLGHEREYDVVLFSPGFPSFDQYTNYIARGEDFNGLVRLLL